MVTQVDKVPTRDQQQDEGQTTPEESINDGLVADEDYWRDERKLIGRKARVNGSRTKADSKLNNEDELSRVNNGSGSCENFEKNWLNEERAESQSIAVRRESENNASLTECSEIENDNDEDEANIYNSYEHSELEGDEEEDGEENEDTDEEIDNANGWVRKKVVTTQVQQQDVQALDDNGHAIQQVMPNLNKTAIGEVNVVNSRHVNFGDRNFYKGPVTIKQFVYTNAYPIQDKNNDPINNNINEAYNGRMSDVELNEVPRVKGNQTILHPYGDYDTVTKWMWTWRCAVVLCALALISVTIVVVASVILASRNNLGPAVLPDAPTSGTNPDDVWVNSVRFVERDEWLAERPKEPLTNLTEVPAPYVIISHTASAPCVMQSECVQRVRRIQTFHIEGNGWNDIGYNFLVGGDGLAYVGRGWDAEGAHSFGWNKKSIGISFIGTFNDVPPYKNQLFAAQKVIEIGVNLSKIAPNYKVLGHRQVSATLSPGDKLYEILQTWDHWSPNPPPLSRAISLNQTQSYCLVFVISILLSLRNIIIPYC